MSDATNVIASGRTQRPDEVRVWDPFVRLFHWSLVALFLFAYFTGGEWTGVHEVAGYIIGGLVALRIAWGFVGSPHARFTSFVHHPRTVVTFLQDSMKLRAERHIGHNPAGGAMVITLLVMIGIIVGSGYMMTTDTFWGVQWVVLLHVAAVNLTLILIALHLAGVALASFEHGENLVRAMVTGFKRRH